MARPQLLLFVVTLLVLAVIASAATDSASAPSPATPSVLTPIAKTPLPSDGPSGDVEDSDAAGVGSPLGTTATKPEDDSATHQTDNAKSGASFTRVTSVVAVAAVSGASYLLF